MIPLKLVGKRLVSKNIFTGTKIYITSGFVFTSPIRFIIVFLLKRKSIRKHLIMRVLIKTLGL